MDDCLITGNEVGINSDRDETTFIRNCTIVGNASHGVVNSDTNSVYDNCTISGNGGHGVFVTRNPGNVGGGFGGGGIPQFNNCIISENKMFGVFEDQNPLFQFHPEAKVMSSVLFNNASGDYRDNNNAIYTGAEAINANVFLAELNLDGNPNFADGASGVWTDVQVVPADDASATQTLLIDSNAAFPQSSSSIPAASERGRDASSTFGSAGASPSQNPSTFDIYYSLFNIPASQVSPAAAFTSGGLAGQLVNPDTSQSRQFLILGNTTDTLLIHGDHSDFVAPGDAYQIHDYHLKAGSSALDAGTSTTFTPAFDIEGVPRGLDVRAAFAGDGTDLDIGAYEALLSDEVVLQILLETNLLILIQPQLDAADANNDGVIDIADVISLFPAPPAAKPDGARSIILEKSSCVVDFEASPAPVSIS